jgi:formylglycine-generating enzyme required for sulfatase activity
MFVIFSKDRNSLLKDSITIINKNRAKKSNQVLRGGSWSFGNNCQVAVRINGSPAVRDYSVGFRISCIVTL